jgi:hypothetical protein
LRLHWESLHNTDGVGTLAAFLITKTLHETGADHSGGSTNSSGLTVG